MIKQKKNRNKKPDENIINNFLGISHSKENNSDINYINFSNLYIQGNTSWEVKEGK